MLQRAASNAYSWWWASHIRTKQSKWLEQSLMDMEEKVASTLKIIDDDGDSFAKRAEMYYRKRPELIGFVEESYKAYRALAERYDHLSREYQSANRKIATVFPDEVPFDIDEEEESIDGSSENAEKQSMDHPDRTKTRIPKVPKLPPKEFRSPSMTVSRKGQLHKTSNSIEAAAVILGSGLTKGEALEEIDKLQKEILTLQTEKEFVKDLYEKAHDRSWEIERQVTEMQARVCNLQDEFGIGTVIEDNEARALMAAAALKSCQQTLSELQERQEQSAEETRIQQERIREAQKRLGSLKSEHHTKRDSNEHTGEEPTTASASPGLKTPDSVEEDNVDLATMRERIKKKLEVDATSFLTVTEMVEKIDDLVEKVVILKTGFFSQAALVERLKEETDKLQEHIRILEEERETLIEGSENMNIRIMELEEELCRVKNLKKDVDGQTNNLLSQFTEASCNADHLSKKLENAQLDEEVDNMGNEDDAEAKEAKGIEENDDNMDSDDKSMTSRDVNRNEDPGQSKTAEEIFLRSGPASDFDALSEKPPEIMRRFKEENEELYDAADNQFDIDPHGSVEGNAPNWRELFLSGADDRERMLLDEYTSLLQSYKEVKKKLSVVEKKNRDSVFELAMQLGELRNNNASKEEEIQALRQKVDAQQTTTDLEPSPEDSQPSVNRQPLYKLLLQHNDIIHGDDKSCSSTTMGEAKVNSSASAIEKKLRKEIDHLLEENLEFWLRFSTSIHQIHKFQTTVHDLQAELSKPKENKSKDANMKQHSLNADARPIYKHLKEIQTELKLWLEQNSLLKEEMQNRSSALCSIQDEIAIVSIVGSGEKVPTLNEFKAAKFQGEVLNMKQENKKVANELEAGLLRVKKLNGEIEKTLSRLEKDLGISASKSHHSRSRSISSRSRIPLRSFLFGVKLKKQKQSIFACVNPAMQKQESNLKPARLPDLD